MKMGGTAITSKNKHRGW